MNYMKKVARMLGVELGEEFNIKGSNDIYRFSEDKLIEWKRCGEWIKEDSLLLIDLITGAEEIEPILDEEEKEELEKLKKEYERLKKELKKWMPRQVEQYTLDGQYVQTFETTSKAAKAMYGFPSCIRKALSGELKTAYGYKWKYAKGDINE